MVVRKKKAKVKPRLSSRPKLITLYEMEIAISKLYGIRQHIIVPNLSWGFLSHEADLFIIKRSGLSVEVEIKRSLQDMKAEKNKNHNHKDKQNRINEFYYAFPIELLEKQKKGSLLRDYILPICLAPDPNNRLDAKTLKKCMFDYLSKE